MSIYTLEFWKDAAERTFFTALAAAAAVMGGEAAFNVVEADWALVGVVTANAAAFTFVKTLLAAQVGSKGTAGVTSSVIPVSPTGAIGEFRQEAGGSLSDTTSTDVETDGGGRHRLRN